MSEKIIGIDLGGTNIRAGLVQNGEADKILSKRTNSDGTFEEVLQDVFHLIDQLFDRSITAIGIGVPSVVDIKTGTVYDVQYIPSWKEVPLKTLLEKRYAVPVFVNNDANCFALGEYHFGKGKGVDSMIGLTIGTGLGSGIILSKKLYAGAHCGAGEFGMVDYLDQFVEYYASGQFFENVYNVDGGEVFRKAKSGDATALKMYEELGRHLGNAIKLVLYTYDVSLIILGGSVRHAYPFFEKAMWERIQTFAYRNTIKNLRIEISGLENSGILGAAALYYDGL
jgi:glucokinase